MLIVNCKPLGPLEFNLAVIYHTDHPLHANTASCIYVKIMRCPRHKILRAFGVSPCIVNHF